MSLMHISLAFIIGFIAGGLIVFLAMVKFSSKHKLLDEMTQIKRANANKDRMIVEFFERAEEQFSLLNKVYMNYAKFMQNNANRFMPQETVFVDDSNNNSEIVDEKAQNKDSKKTAFVPTEEKNTSFVPEISSNDVNTMAYVQKLEKQDSKDQQNKDTEQRTEEKKDSSVDEIIDDISVINAALKADDIVDNKVLSEKVDNKSTKTNAHNEIKI